MTADEHGQPLRSRLVPLGRSESHHPENARRAPPAEAGDSLEIAVVAPERPRLGSHVRLLGLDQGREFPNQPWLVERAGQTRRMPDVLYRIVEQIDGERSLAEIATGVSATTGRRVTVDNVRQLISTKLIPSGLVAEAAAPAREHPDTTGESRRSPRGPASDVDHEPSLVYRWLLETSLVWARWGAAALALSLIPLFPSVPLPLSLLPALILALGNAGLTWWLRQRRSAQRLRGACWLATGLEWAAALAVLGLFDWGPPGEVRVSILLLLVMVAGVRFGLTGLTGAAGAAALVVGVLLGTHILLRGGLDGRATQGLLQGWEVAVVAVLLIAGLVAAREQWRRWAEAQWSQDQEAVQRVRFGLSAREWSLLPLLARDELTYEHIGTALGISSETVKTYVQRIGKKLGVTGRRAVVSAARQHGLLRPTQPDLAASESERAARETRRAQVG